jgi:hypothetical protein
MLKNIPKGIESPYHIHLFITNIFFPGVGTIICAFLAKSERKRKMNLVYGISQFILAPVIIGWVWSIIWGFCIYKRNHGVAKYIPDALVPVAANKVTKSNKF